MQPPSSALSVLRYYYCAAASTAIFIFIALPFLIAGGLQHITALLVVGSLIFVTGVATLCIAVYMRDTYRRKAREWQEYTTQRPTLSDLHPEPPATAPPYPVQHQTYPVPQGSPCAAYQEPHPQSIDMYNDKQLPLVLQPSAPPPSYDEVVGKTI